MITREQALNILHEHTKSLNLRRHGLAVEAAMKALANYFKVPLEDIEKWDIVGLLHDADYEETKDKVERHGLETVEWLKAAGENDQDLFDAISGHNYSRNMAQPPNNNLGWTVYCCDELTGLIVAVALVRPEKKLSSVTVETVLKKLNEKGFAAAVNRDQINMCEEKLGIPLPKFVKIILDAMQKIANELGL